MTPIFYIALGVALLLIAEEIANNVKFYRKDRREREYRNAVHKENGLAIFREINRKIDAPLNEDEND